MFFPLHQAFSLFLFYLYLLSSSPPHTLFVSPFSISFLFNKSDPQWLLLTHSWVWAEKMNHHFSSLFLCELFPPVCLIAGIIVVSILATFSRPGQKNCWTWPFTRRCRWNPTRSGKGGLYAYWRYTCVCVCIQTFTYVLIISFFSV